MVSFINYNHRLIANKELSFVIEMKFSISNHAREELERRKIPLALVESVLNDPQQIVEEISSRKTYQSQIDFGDRRVFLLRVIVADDVHPPVVVTVHRTNKIDKYWR
jgi:hypothetical protein